jgi:hypothetical protein
LDEEGQIRITRGRNNDVQPRKRKRAIDVRERIQRSLIESICLTITVKPDPSGGRAVDIRPIPDNVYQALAPGDIGCFDSSEDWQCIDRGVSHILEAGIAID